MNARQISDAFKLHLTNFATFRDLPVAWPNVDFTPTTTPYLELQFAPVPNQRLTLGARTKVYGSAVITVVAAKGAGSQKADILADDLALYFPVDAKLDLDANTLRITAAPSIREGFRDGSHWRVPVIIPYEVLI